MSNPRIGDTVRVSSNDYTVKGYGIDRNNPTQDTEDVVRIQKDDWSRPVSVHVSNIDRDDDGYYVK